MGPGIALTLALSSGARTVLVSRTAEGAERGMRKARALAEVLRSSDLITDGATEDSLGRLTTSTDLDSAICGADYVPGIGTGRSGVETRNCSPAWTASPGASTVLASNTSGLSITAIAARCLRPERVLTTHYWNPPHLIPLVEIVKGEKTAGDVVEAVRGLLETCGKTPAIVQKDRPGQLGNRLQMALVREALYILGEGIADADAIDSVIRNGLGIRMPDYGTLEHMDIAGLDLAISVLDYVAPDLCVQGGAPEYMRQKSGCRRFGRQKRPRVLRLVHEEC